MVLIDFLNKTIPGGGQKTARGGQKKLFSRKILPPLAKILCTRLKQRHYNLYQADRTEAHFDQCKKTEKACKKSVRSAKRKFEQNIAKNGNKRPFNSYIKSKTASKVNIGPLKVGNELVSDNLGMASILNNTFSTVFTVEDQSNVPHCPPLTQQFSVTEVHFDLESIKKKIMKLKCSSSSGPDNISSRFLQNHVDSLVSPLSIIFSKSLESGIVPQDWRDANVTPIFNTMQNHGIHYER